MNTFHWLLVTIILAMQILFIRSTKERDQLIVSVVITSVYLALVIASAYA